MSEEKKAYDEWMQLHVCDDPYWKMPTRYMDPSRIGGIQKKLDRFEKIYPMCVDDLYSGVPSYYCILCISKNATPEIIKDAYERKKNCSSYPAFVIERAYEMLSDEKKSKDYENILNSFLKILMGYSITEKQELKEHHAYLLDMEKKSATKGYIKDNRSNWIDLLFNGAPTIYEMLNIDKTELNIDPNKELKYKSDDHSIDEKLRKEIYNILNNAQLRFEYDFMLDEIDEILEFNNINDIEYKRNVWMGKSITYLIFLKYNHYVRQYENIMEDHPEFEKYIDSKTLYDVMGIDIASIPEDKKEAEKFIRNVYKNKERTAEVNLAYGILKIFKLRTKYNWLLKHVEWIKIVYKFDIMDGDEMELKRAMKLAELCLKGL